MEDHITTIGTLLLGAFYAIGYVLNRQATKKNEPSTRSDSLEDGQSEFFATLSSTASQSTSLNMQLWQRVMDLEDQQEENQRQLEMLKRSNQQKDRRIATLEKQIQHIKTENTQLLRQLKLLEP